MRVLNSFAKQAYLEVVIFECKKFVTADIIKEKIEAVKSITDDLFGACTCLPVFRFNIGTNLEIEGFINEKDHLIAFDEEALNQLIIDDVFDRVFHKRNYTPGQKEKRAKRKKSDEVIGPMTEHGFDLGKVPERERFFYTPEMQAESDKLGHLMNGFPFKDWSADENALWLEREVILGFRSLFPLIYEYGKMQNNIVEETFKVMLDKSLYAYLPPKYFNVSRCFCNFNHHRAIHPWSADLKYLQYFIHERKFDVLKRILKTRERKASDVDYSDDEPTEMLFIENAHAPDTLGIYEEPYNPD